MSARRVLAGTGLLGAAVLLVLYGPELFVHGSPPTVRWLREHVGRAGLIAVNVAAGAAFLLLLPYRREGAAAWRSRGAFLAFVLALMTEMFGWPLLVYLLAPLVDVPALAGGRHPLGHWGAQAGTWLSTIGLLLVVAGWRRIHAARGLVTDGLYAGLRHPQYAGLLLFTLGWLLHWPTVLTLALWPLLAAAYVRLALAEERALAAEWGEAYRAWARRTPRFLPRIVQRRAGT